jgi:hypothetical protein
MRSVRCWVTETGLGWVVHFRLQCVATVNIPVTVTVTVAVPTKAYMPSWCSQVSAEFAPLKLSIQQYVHT